MRLTPETPLVDALARFIGLSTLFGAQICPGAFYVNKFIREFGSDATMEVFRIHFEQMVSPRKSAWARQILLVFEGDMYPEFAQTMLNALDSNYARSDARRFAPPGLSGYEGKLEESVLAGVRARREALEPSERQRGLDTYWVNAEDVQPVSEEVEIAGPIRGAGNGGRA
jgi:hypothetical protein